MESNAILMAINQRAKATLHSSELKTKHLNAIYLAIESLPNQLRTLKSAKHPSAAQTVQKKLFLVFAGNRKHFCHSTDDTSVAVKQPYLSTKSKDELECEEIDQLSRADSSRLSTVTPLSVTASLTPPKELLTRAANRYVFYPLPIHFDETSSSTYATGCEEQSGDKPQVT